MRSNKMEKMFKFSQLLFPLALFLAAIAPPVSTGVVGPILTPLDSCNGVEMRKVLEQTDDLHFIALCF